MLRRLIPQFYIVLNRLIAGKYRFSCKNVSSQSIHPFFNFGATLAITLPFTKYFLPAKDTDCIKYWCTTNNAEVISKADELYNLQKYVEVYELLNRIKYTNQPDILWRIVRALYKISTTSPALTIQIKTNIILEAKELIELALILTNENANVHKWAAVVYDCANGLEGLKFTTLDQIQNHLTKAAELDENQTALYFMLGKIAFDLASLSWFQRKLAENFYENGPEGSFEVAYEYFMKAERLTPGFYIGNLLMLGKASVKLGKLHQAKYYFNLATTCTVRNEEDKKLHAEASNLAKKFADYDVSKGGLTHEEKIMQPLNS